MFQTTPQTLFGYQNEIGFKYIFFFVLSVRFEAQLLANVTLGIPMQSYMGLCMSLRHPPCDVYILTYNNHVYS